MYFTEENQSCSMVSHSPQATTAGQTLPRITSVTSATSSEQTLPRITSVTSIRHQQHLLGNQIVSLPQAPQYQDPSWNIPGPSRGPAPMQHRQMDPFSGPPCEHQPMPVALSRHGDEVMVGMEVGDAEGGEEEEEMPVLSEEVLQGMPAATEMGELRPEDLELNGVDVSAHLRMFSNYESFCRVGIELCDIM